MGPGTWEEALFVDRAAADPDAPVPRFVAVQRVVVRMLFDPAFTARVYEDPERALAGIDVDSVLVRQLLENDRRLWNADRLRRSRALKILMDEFKVTTTLALNECRRVAFLDAFFGSEFFHRAVQRRDYMALAFVAYLEDAASAGRLRSRHFLAALRLESAMARSRRELRDARRGRDRALAPVAPGRAGERWLAKPGVRSVFVPGGTIALVHRIEKHLFELSQVPALALCDDAPRPEPLPDLSEDAPQAFLLEPEPGGKVNLSEVPATFARIVEACARPVDAAALAAAVKQHGVAAEDAPDLAAQLLAAGVLRRVVVEADGRVQDTIAPFAADDSR
jgi:hypothetical protein